MSSCDESTARMISAIFRRASTEGSHKCCENGRCRASARERFGDFPKGERQGKPQALRKRRARVSCCHKVPRESLMPRNPGCNKSKKRAWLKFKKKCKPAWRGQEITGELSHEGTGPSSMF